METLTACPLCGGTTHSMFDRRKISGRTITNQLCKDCGLVFQSPRMTEAECAAFYSGEFRKHNGPTEARLSFQRAKADSIASIAKKHVPAVTSALDIGSSAGVLLNTFRRQF